MAAADRKRKAKIIIVGGGIAGASLSYFLAQRGLGDAILLEREERNGYHASGRSAAAQDELRLDPVLHRLLTAGAELLRRPPPGFAPEPILDPTGVFELLDEAGLAEVERAAARLEEDGTRLELLSAEEVRHRMPVVSGGRFAGGVWLPECGRLNVDALLSGYLLGARRGGVELRTGVEVVGVLRRGDRCVGVETREGPLEADLVVDAAGAWAGRVAEMADAARIELSPRRRTIVTFASEVCDPGWPLVSDEVLKLYFAPEGDGLLACPMDEDPVEPCDARPELGVVYETLERLGELAPSLVPREPTSARAGLRTFAPDGRPVVGEDPRRRGFFWLAGQGGCGIETSPAIGRIAADLIATGESDWRDLQALLPDRFA